jgi:hypothetical protein
MEDTCLYGNNRTQLTKPQFVKDCQRTEVCD